NNVVALELSQVISNTSDDAIAGINSPVISQRSFKTSLLVGDGQTAVVGGLISENNTKGNSKVPGAGDLPVIGNLFKSETQGRDKTEIVVMITPRIIRDTEALDQLSQQLTQGMERLLPMGK
ncbi:type II secretion system protein GspD, partial [Pontibacterium sp.]|uniref:type II secretion system protein GspD n=1 Tax=Pontibacterium sp. TaxID=2036026 RepID=UPI0035653432